MGSSLDVWPLHVGNFVFIFMGHTHITCSLVIPIVTTILNIPAYHPFIAGIIVNFQNCNTQFYTVTLYASLKFSGISTLFMQIKYNTHDFTIMLHTILSFQQSVPSTMTTFLRAILSLVFIAVHEVIS